MGILERLSEVNALRSKEAFNMPVEETELWRFAFGLMGEANEVGQDIRKMHENRKDISPGKIAEELADVVIYAELICQKLGHDLGSEIKKKFNQVSKDKEVSIFI